MGLENLIKNTYVIKPQFPWLISSVSLLFGVSRKLILLRTIPEKAFRGFQQNRQSLYRLNPSLACFSFLFFHILSDTIMRLSTNMTSILISNNSLPYEGPEWFLQSAVTVWNGPVIHIPSYLTYWVLILYWVGRCTQENIDINLNSSRWRLGIALMCCH